MNLFLTDNKKLRQSVNLFLTGRGIRLREIQNRLPHASIEVWSYLRKIKELSARGCGIFYFAHAVREVENTASACLKFPWFFRHTLSRQQKAPSKCELVFDGQQKAPSKCELVFDWTWNTPEWGSKQAPSCRDRRVKLPEKNQGSKKYCFGVPRVSLILSTYPLWTTKNSVKVWTCFWLDVEYAWVGLKTSSHLAGNSE